MFYMKRPPSLKYMKRAGIYQGSNYNVTFNPKTNRAVSYKWWTFVAKIEGKLVFNNYRYSVSTAKQQSKVRSLLQELNIKIDIEMPLPKGIESGDSLAEMILKSEEHLCDKFFAEVLKKQEQYQRAKARKFKKKLEQYLDTQVNFRDYDIQPKNRFGQINKIAVHQVVEDIEQDVQNALYNFNRDGFGSIIFYVDGI